VDHVVLSLSVEFADKLAQAIEHAGLYQEAKRESVEKGILIEVQTGKERVVVAVE